MTIVVPRLRLPGLKLIDLHPKEVEVLAEGCPFNFVLDITLSTLHVRFHCLAEGTHGGFAEDFERALKDARRGPDNLLTQLVEVLSLAQLDRRGELRDLVPAFKARHPAFDPPEFLRRYPITAAGAKRLFMEGVEKAGLS